MQSPRDGQGWRRCWRVSRRVVSTQKVPGCDVMRSSVRSVHQIVAGIEPLDEIEAAHQADTLRWLEATDDIYRRAKPATPDRHLVSYVALVDPDGSTLLVDHINAGRHLPPGGHVERDEHPVDTARREAREELGIEARFVDAPPRPAFVTVTVTGGIDAGHTDVSLWYLLAGHRDMPLLVDASEFRGIRWWTAREVRTSDPDAFDPHYSRFLSKLGL